MKIDLNVIVIFFILLFLSSKIGKCYKCNENFESLDKFKSLDKMTNLANNLDLTLRGILHQDYVGIEFYLLEFKIDTDNPNSKLYKYYAVQKDNDTSYRAVHELPIRNRIENGDVISIKGGSAWYGPWIFVEYDF